MISSIGIASPSMWPRASTTRCALLCLLASTAASEGPQLELNPLEEGWRRLYLVRHGETDWCAASFRMKRPRVSPTISRRHTPAIQLLPRVLACA